MDYLNSCINYWGVTLFPENVNSFIFHVSSENKKITKVPPLNMGGLSFFLDFTALWLIIIIRVYLN